MNISVIIPLYNAEHYIEKAVESALQFDEVKEIVIVEDGSKDESLSKANALQDKYAIIQVYQHPNGENKGAGPTRNLGIEKAKAEFIAFLDADDYFLPNRFDAEKELFKNPEVEGVYGALGVEYYSEKAKEQYYTVFEDKLTTVYKKHPPEDVFPGQLFLKGSFGLFSIDTLTLRKNALKKMPYLFLEGLRLHQDSEFLIRLSFYLDLYAGIIDKPIAIRGVHENNRITAVDTKKINPASTRVLLWNALHNWAKNEEKVSSLYKKHIATLYASYHIANQKGGFKKLFYFSHYIFLYPKIVKGIYRKNYV